MSEWLEMSVVKLTNGSYYELAFWNRAVSYQHEGQTIRAEGSFHHQGILQYDNGFLVDGYWLRPTPTHVKEIILSLPVKSAKL